MTYIFSDAKTHTRREIELLNHVMGIEVTFISSSHPVSAFYLKSRVGGEN